MGGYKVRVRVEIVPEELDAAPLAAPGQIDRVDEQVVEAVTTEQAFSIDDMEEALLRTGYAAMRQAVADHFGKMSKKGRPSTPPKA